MLRTSWVDRLRAGALFITSFFSFSVLRAPSLTLILQTLSKSITTMGISKVKVKVV